MTKQRLAEIMNEIDEGCEELCDNGTSVLLGVMERKKDGCHVGVLGCADSDATDKIVVSMLKTNWENDNRGMTWSEYLTKLCVAAVMAEDSGQFKKGE